jgi:glutamyl-tRNA synthetase
MVTRVRFAPSPTGKLHVGNIRTALVNWLFAHSPANEGQAGTFILRIDDTDLERSTKANEDGIRADLAWLGLTWDETFRQSERFDRYRQVAEDLKAEGLLYACYETADELERRRKIALSRGKPPVYDRAALELTDKERKAMESEGREPHWRFKLSGKEAAWVDLVRGQQSIDTSSVSDPILIREDGSFLYTLPSVVDDVDSKITHIVRGEDHVTNSGAQIEIFIALGSQPPQMAHMPLLIGADGQGLSKRLGSLSAEQLRNEGYEPMAITSLLAKLGTSDSVEARASLQQLAMEFSFSKIGRAPARFDEQELHNLNAQIVLWRQGDGGVLGRGAQQPEDDPGHGGLAGRGLWRRADWAGPDRGGSRLRRRGGEAVSLRRGRPRRVERLDRGGEGEDRPQGQAALPASAPGADRPGARTRDGPDAGADRRQQGARAPRAGEPVRRG